MTGTADREGGTEVLLLGPLAVRVAGAPVATGGPRQRALLALLALAVGAPLGPGQLIDALWDESPPPTAANTVQVYVSRLRRLLAGPDGSSPLRTVNGMYVLEMAPDAVDAIRFERLCEVGRSLLAAGDPAGAADRLRAAEALWRGAALPDLAPTTAGAAALARLEALRRAAVADRIDADAALGRQAALVPELRELVLRHPLDERFVGQLMTALYRDGRQAEALGAFAAAAARLADELGVDPGPALRELHTRVLRQDGGLDPAPAAPPPPAPRAPPTPPAPPAPVSRAPAARVRRAELPPAGPLVGRRAELAAALDLLPRADVRLLTLVGPGGAGKTRLAAEIAAVHLAQAPELVEFVPLAAVTDHSQLLTAVCRAIGGEPDWVAEPPIDVLARTLADRPALIVLDNLEQVPDAGRGPVDELLERIPDVTVLATSRSVLRSPYERVLPVGPLPLPVRPDAGAGSAGPGDVRAAALDSDAVQLFRERARAVLPSFEVTEANAGSVTELCRSLDGLPLALELAAARVRVLPPEEILARLDRRMDLLAGGGEHLPERQRSMWAALDWSAKLLDPAELEAFGRLSVFAGGWSLAAAEDVCAPAGEAVALVTRLADQSLVVADGTGRLGMLETVRDYARQVLRAEPAVDASARGRHAEHYAALAERLGPLSRGWQTMEGPSPRDLLELEGGNLATALEHAAAEAGAGHPGGGELLARLVAGLLDHWFVTGRVREASRWLQAARAADLSGATRARLLLSFGNLSFVGGDPPAAAAALAEAHAAADQVGDPLLRARTRAASAVAARYLDEPGRALELLAGALDLVAADPGAAAALQGPLENELGEVLDELGRADEARDLWAQCRRRATEDGNAVLLVHPLVNLARAALESGDATGARVLMAEALAAAEASDSVPVLVDALVAAGFVDQRLGDPAGAAGRLREAVRLAHECGQLISLPEAVSLLGAALRAADPAVAARLLGAGAAWRSARSLALVGRGARSVVTRAEESLAGGATLSAERVSAERERGARTPFGSLRGLELLDPGLRRAGVQRVIDLMGDAPRVERVIDLRSSADAPPAGTDRSTGPERGGRP